MLEGKKSEIHGFTDKTPKEKIQAFVNDVDISKLTSLMNLLWDRSKNPATKFARDEKYEKQLKNFGIMVQPILSLALASKQQDAMVN